MVTKALVPLNVKALPYLPEVVHVAPLIVPSFPLLDTSLTTLPLPSLNPYAATRPSVGDGVGVAVGIAVGVGLGAMVAVAVGVGLEIIVAVGVAVAVAVGVTVAVAVGVGLRAMVAVGVGVGVPAGSLPFTILYPAGIRSLSLLVGAVES
jgi:hypothetical protein